MRQFQVIKARCSLVFPRELNILHFYPAEHKTKFFHCISSGHFRRYLVEIAPVKVCVMTLNQKQIDISFSCVCAVIDHEFRHNIVKVAVDPRGESRVNPQTTLTML